MFPRRLLGISSTSLVGLPTWYQVSGCFFFGDVELFDSIRVPQSAKCAISVEIEKNNIV